MSSLHPDSREDPTNDIGTSPGNRINGRLLVNRFNEREAARDPHAPFEESSHLKGARADATAVAMVPAEAVRSRLASPMRASVQISHLLGS